MKKPNDAKRDIDQSIDVAELSIWGTELKSARGDGSDLELWVASTFRTR
ncbi:MAG: hypothetical protein KDB23_21515 [Planctomycetales bacterium]|nr:hypothetical protein [Planctomycetales bacterium]